MARKRYKPEEIVAKLRQVDVLVSQGQNMVDAIRQIGVSEVTYYRWRQEFGGLKTEGDCMARAAAEVGNVVPNANICRFIKSRYAHTRGRLSRMDHAAT